MQMTKALRRVFLEARADLLHHLEIDAEQVIAAHARLAWHAGGDDANVGAVDRLVGIGADQCGVEAVDRGRLGKIERLALRDALGDVEQHDIAQFLEADEMGERATDLTRADQRNLVTLHVGKCPYSTADRNATAARVLARSGGAFKSQSCHRRQ